MDLLPETPECQKHIKTHKAAHRGIYRGVERLSSKIGDEPPLMISQKMYKVISGMLGEHVSRFDDHLVQLGSSISIQEDFDQELVAMLDKHVFPNRPGANSSAKLTDNEQKRLRLEVRGCYESLTPAQREVFRLVVNGKKNPEIANELGISINTVKTHRSAVFNKMRVKSVVELLKKVDVLR